MIWQLQRLWKTQGGSAALEFAIAGPIFLTLLLFVLEASLLLWAKEAVEMAAWSTARCIAVRSSDCADPQAYASALMSTWGVDGIIPSTIVTVNSGTTCSGAAGLFISVTISSTTDMAAGFIAPLSSTVLSSSACYPLISASGINNNGSNRAPSS